LGAVFLIGVIFKLSGIFGYIYLFLVNLITLAGSGVAARQFWLQYIAPPQKITCAASLEHLMEIYPFFDALKIVLIGSGDCSVIDFRILGMSIAAWSLLAFGTMFILALYFTYRYASKKDTWNARIKFR
jgi:disulfide bond formation protein DsbB